ncbi:MAG: hypothetical protein RDV48_07295 [Candidatus Eremiobacteraeota bacterium]|nr:hypothetical protein [Candidatus Eremiobacteraeota bacterium]
MAGSYELRVKIDEKYHRLGDIEVSGTPCGGSFEGDIVLIPSEDVNCRGLWLEIGYKEGGMGTPHDQQMVQEMFFHGNLIRNNPVEKHFAFKVPREGPVTYKGSYAKFEWYVRVRIDIPFWFDKREEREFTVLPRLK